MDEVVDAVPARVLPGDERRPGDRAQRRHAGFEGPEVALGDQPGEVRQHSLVDEPLEQHRIQTVHTEHEHLLGGGAHRRDQDRGHENHRQVP